MQSNWKYRKRDFYRAAIECTQSQGITLNGCFVLSLDGDMEEAFNLIPRFVEETALYDDQVNEALIRRHRRFLEVYGGRFREAHAPELVTS